MSVGYIPQQQQFISPYNDHRWSNVIGRFVRTIVGDVQNIILPYSANNFTLEIDSSTQTGINISPGICILSDTLIHTKESITLDFTNPLNYVGDFTSLPPIISEVMDSSSPYRFFILGYFNYQRTIPQPQFSFVICKQRSQFLTNQDLYLYLGSAIITTDMSGTFISNITYKDTNEFDSDAVISRVDYEYHPPKIDAGCIDSTSGPSVPGDGMFADLTVE